MKKMLLTSNGVNTPNFKNNFLKLINKPIEQVKIVLISESKSETISIYYLGMDIKGLVDLGMKLENITIYSLTQGEKINLSNYDIIFVCGGNTFHYLSMIKKLGLDNQIIQHVNDGKIYVGESAGSIIVGPILGFSNDENDINLKNLTGLNIVDFIIIPHYTSQNINKFKKESNKKIIPLTDDQMILINNSKIKII